MTSSSTHMQSWLLGRLRQEDYKFKTLLDITVRPSAYVYIHMCVYVRVCTYTYMYHIYIYIIWKALASIFISEKSFDNSIQLLNNMPYKESIATTLGGQITSSTFLRQAGLFILLCHSVW